MDKRKVLKILDAMSGDLDIQELIDKLTALKKTDAAERQVEKEHGGPPPETKRKPSPYMN